MDRNRKAPEYVARALARFGRNPWGAPIFRVVWSEAEHKTVGGEFHDGFRVVREYRYVPKYRATARWVLEMWKPTPVSPKRWECDEYDHLSGLMKSGPYPYRGEYWAVMVLQGPKGEYVPLSPGLVQFVAGLISRSQSVTAWESFVAMRAEEERKQRETSARNRAIISDAISAFGNAAHSSHYGKSKEKTRRFLGEPTRMAPFGQLQPHLIDPRKRN